ncbi:hypothetical protein GALMADRAFT_229827 [Galerina marginata CBS 339.88]|uniref:Glycoside hydrolase 131 catalytic N-terminal domain-containing protein n=1 Tax=Galerina marginata (strain CBS 339.88) TaxID=685588 RepID=A0A067SIM5_GALM3|nr:hypothetical protein GALMADRAFT_229827 [Galerina marginata CBS 339.88]
MSFRTFAICALLTLQSLRGLASPLETTATEELVKTPGGLFPKSNVHAVPEGARVHHTGTEVHLIGADGAIIHSAPVSTQVSTNPKFTATKTSVAPRALTSGYVAYSYWKNAGKSNIASFSTSWTVPPLPAKQDGQILYIFNALVPNSFDGIFQPVLQFGYTPAGGGNYWAVASWYLIGTHTYYTAPAQVSVGQNLTGVMKFLSSSKSGSTTTYLWNSVFTGIPSTSLTIGSDEIFNYAYEALEIYTATGPSDLPTGTTMMGNITIATVDGAHPALNWTSVSDSTEGFQMAVVSSASTNGAMRITYP